MAVNDLDVVRITAGMLFGGSEDQQNVYNVLKVSGGSVSDGQFMTDIAARLEVLYTTVLARQITSLTYDQITGKKVFGGADLMPDTSWPTLVAGTQTSDALPLANAALVNGQTTGSKVQGRKYLGAYTEVDNVNGVLSATLLTAIGNFAANWITDFVAGGMTYRFGVFNPISTVFTPFVSALLIGAFRTQRRRTAGFGS